MSERLSSVEIEDVLSSIRRLVSEDRRPASRAGRSVAGSADGKLLLTPALRVVPGRTAASAIGKVVAVVGAAVAAQNDEWEPEQGDLEIQGRQSAFEVQDWSAERVAVAGNSGGRAVDAWPSRPLDLHEVDETAGDPEAGPDIVEFESRVLVLQGAMKAAEVVAPAPDQASAQALEARIMADLAADEATADAARQPADDEEKILRAMVRDIIRDELQGDLGERITRNIRKLVRAEIARAIASNALDQHSLAD